MLVSAESHVHKLISREIILPNSNACDHNESTNVTDGRTDRRTDGRTDGRTDRQLIIMAIPRYPALRAVIISKNNGNETTVLVKKSPPPIFLMFFSTNGWNFNFSRLIHSYLRWTTNFLFKLSATLTKLCHSKRDLHPLYAQNIQHWLKHAGWSQIMWHNFVKVGDRPNWI